MKITYILIFLIGVLAICILVERRSISLKELPRKNKNIKNIKIIISHIKPSFTNLPHVLFINSFESKKDINNWFIRSGNVRLSRSNHYKTQGNFSMKIDFKDKKKAKLALIHFPKYWHYFQMLSFDIFNPCKKKMDVIFWIGDYFDNSSWYENASKFKQLIEIKPGLNHYTFFVTKIAKKIDIDSIKKHIHFDFNNPVCPSIYLDNIKLIR